MKKTSIILLLLALCLSFNSCFLLPIGPPPSDLSDLGEPKTFEKASISLLLTDKFTETESERGFDAYYTADFCGVTVEKKLFTEVEGSADQSNEELIRYFLASIDRSDIEPQERDGLWYYVKYEENSYRCVHAYVYKGGDAFYIVQYIMNIIDEVDLQDTVHEWAKATKIAPVTVPPALA